MMAEPTLDMPKSDDSDAAFHEGAITVGRISGVTVARAPNDPLLMTGRGLLAVAIGGFGDLGSSRP